MNSLPGKPTDVLARQALTNWLCIPEGLADTRLSLTELSEQMEHNHGGAARTWSQRFTKLLKNPDFQRNTLKLQATYGLRHVPDLLNNLLKASNAGSVKAAEVYLHHIRTVLANQHLVEVHQHLHVGDLYQRMEIHADKLKEMMANYDQAQLTMGQPQDHQSLRDPPDEHPADRMAARAAFGLRHDSGSGKPQAGTFSRGRLPRNPVDSGTEPASDAPPDTPNPLLP